jgi:hypothetical protein
VRTNADHVDRGPLIFIMGASVPEALLKLRYSSGGGFVLEYHREQLTHTRDDLHQHASQR